MCGLHPPANQQQLSEELQLVTSDKSVAFITQQPQELNQII